MLTCMGIIWDPSLLACWVAVELLRIEYHRLQKSSMLKIQVQFWGYYFIKLLYKYVKIKIYLSPHWSLSELIPLNIHALMFLNYVQIYTRLMYIKHFDATFPHECCIMSLSFHYWVVHNNINSLYIFIKEWSGIVVNTLYTNKVQLRLNKTLSHNVDDIVLKFQ